jgi:hypothetical protein
LYLVTGVQTCALPISYVALFELIFRPHHWYKTEHGLHLEEEATQSGER